MSFVAWVENEILTVQGEESPPPPFWRVNIFFGNKLLNQISVPPEDLSKGIETWVGNKSLSLLHVVIEGGGQVFQAKIGDNQEISLPNPPFVPKSPSFREQNIKMEGGEIEGPFKEVNPNKLFERVLDPASQNWEGKWETGGRQEIFNKGFWKVQPVQEFQQWELSNVGNIPNWVSFLLFAWYSERGRTSAFVTINGTDIPISNNFVILSLTSPISSLSFRFENTQQDVVWFVFPQFSDVQRSIWTNSDSSRSEDKVFWRAKIPQSSVFSLSFSFSLPFLSSLPPSFPFLFLPNGERLEIVSNKISWEGNVTNSSLEEGRQYELGIEVWGQNRKLFLNRQLEMEFSSLPWPEGEEEIKLTPWVEFLD